MQAYTSGKFVNIHTHQDNHAENELALSNIFAHEISSFPKKKDSYYSVGIHPWYLDKLDSDIAIEEIRNAVKSSQVIAIGECGLDRAIETPLDIQTEIFVEQLKIAEENDKPVVIHCVRAYPEVISIRNKYKFKVPWIMHGFTGHGQVAKQLIEKDCYLAFGKFLFYRESKAPVLFPDLPDERIFLECDEEKIPIEQVYNRAAELKNVSLEQLISITLENFKRVFKWKE